MADNERECIHCGHAESEHVDTRGIKGQRQVPWCNYCNTSDRAAHSFHPIQNTERGAMFEELDPSSGRYHGHTGGGPNYAGKQWVHQHDGGNMEHEHFRQGVHTTGYHATGYQENVPDKLPPDIRDRDISKAHPPGCTDRCIDAISRFPHIKRDEYVGALCAKHRGQFLSATSSNARAPHRLPSEISDIDISKSMGASCTKCGQPLTDRDPVQFRDKYTGRMKQGFLDLKATSRVPNSVMVSVTHRQARGGGITSMNRAVWASQIAHVECPVQKSLNDMHSHEDDEQEDAKFHGAHQHLFEEADDHYHTSASGDDVPISPHNVPGHYCSSCGGRGVGASPAKCGRREPHTAHGAGRSFCVGNMNAPIAGRTETASASAVPDRVPKTWARIRPKKEYPPEITARAKYVPGKREAEIGKRVDTILALRHKFHGTATDRMGKSMNSCVTCSHGADEHRANDLGDGSAGECRLCACDAYKKERTCVDCQHGESEHHTARAYDSQGTIETGCDNCKCIKYREPSVGRWAKPRDRKIPTDKRIDTALALRAKWHGTGHSQIDKSWSPEDGRPSRFRPLNDEEEARFRKWARENPPSEDEKDSARTDAQRLYHPVVHDEWSKIRAERMGDKLPSDIRDRDVKKSMPMDGPEHVAFPESGADLYNHMLTGHGRGTKTGWNLISGAADLENPRVKALLHRLHLGDHGKSKRPFVVKAAQRLMLSKGWQNTFCADCGHIRSEHEGDHCLGCVKGSSGAESKCNGFREEGEHAYYCEQAMGGKYAGKPGSQPGGKTKCECPRLEEARNEEPKGASGVRFNDERDVGPQDHCGECGHTRGAHTPANFDNRGEVAHCTWCPLKEGRWPEHKFAFDVPEQLPSDIRDMKIDKSHDDGPGPAWDIHTTNEWHGPDCALTEGKRGGVKFHVERWRRNGATKTWKTRPGEFRIPIKNGLRNYGSIDHTDHLYYHPADRCPEEARHETALQVRATDQLPSDIRDMKIDKSRRAFCPDCGHMRCLGKCTECPSCARGIGPIGSTESRGGPECSFCGKPAAHISNGGYGRTSYACDGCLDRLAEGENKDVAGTFAPIGGLEHCAKCGHLFDHSKDPIPGTTCDDCPSCRREEPREHTHFGGFPDNPGPSYRHTHGGPMAHEHPEIPDKLPDDIRDRDVNKSRRLNSKAVFTISGPRYCRECRADLTGMKAIDIGRHMGGHPEGRRAVITGIRAGYGGLPERATPEPANGARHRSIHCAYGHHDGCERVYQTHPKNPAAKAGRKLTCDCRCHPSDKLPDDIRDMNIEKSMHSADCRALLVSPCTDEKHGGVDNHCWTAHPLPGGGPCNCGGIKRAADRARAELGLQLPEHLSPTGRVPTRLPAKIRDMNIEKSRELPSGPGWRQNSKPPLHRDARGYFYVNRGEDEGTVSAVVPSAQHVLRLRKSGDYCGADSDESPAVAEEKLSHGTETSSPKEFASTCKKRGSYSGLLAPSGKVYAKPGYQEHENMIDQAHMHHDYHGLVNAHGWARLSTKGANMNIDFNHDVMSRDTASRLHQIASLHGRVNGWTCYGQHRGGWEYGRDGASLAEHLEEEASKKSFSGTCAICKGPMRVERICNVCERPVCSKDSRPIMGTATACHECIKPDLSGRSANASYRAGTSMQTREYFRLMREKENRKYGKSFRLTQASMSRRPSKRDLDKVHAWAHGQASGGRPHANDRGEWNGRRFWSGSVSRLDGKIEEVHPYRTAQAADFHHRLYQSPGAVERQRTGESAFFWMGHQQAERGKVRIEDGFGDSDAPEAEREALASKIQGQIKVHP